MRILATQLFMTLHVFNDCTWDVGLYSGAKMYLVEIHLVENLLKQICTIDEWTSVKVAKSTKLSPRYLRPGAIYIIASF